MLYAIEVNIMPEEKLLTTSSLYAIRDFINECFENHLTFEETLAILEGVFVIKNTLDLGKNVSVANSILVLSEQTSVVNNTLLI